MRDYQTKGYSTWGASMGRKSDLDTSTSAALEIHAVAIDRGGYDPGGAYWGSPSDLWMVEDPDSGEVFYTRATSLETVKAMFSYATWIAPSLPTEDDVSDMLQAYIECAFWLATEGENGETLEDLKSESDLVSEALASMRARVEAFASAAGAILAGAIGKPGPYPHGKDPSYSTAGHDLYLDSNGHGAGFKDGHWVKEASDLLSAAAHKIKGLDLYIGDDGKVYAS